MDKEINLLLINPWIYDFAAFDLYMKPLGLLYLSSHLKKAGANIFFIDCMNRLDEFFIKNKFIKNKKYGTGKFYYEEIEKPEILNFYPRKFKRYGIPYEEVKKRLISIKNSNKIDAILITSMMTYWYKGVFDMIKLVKKIFPQTPIFLGGIYASLMKEHATKYSNADYVVTGNNIKEIIKFIFTKINISYNESILPENFNEWLFPDYNLYSQLSYLVIMSSISCPFKCTYCASRLLYPHYFRYPSEKLFQNLIYYADKFNIKDIAFYDDALLFNFKNNLKEFLDLILKNNYKFNFHTPNGLHIKFINEEVAEYLYNTNFKTIRLSLETSNVVRQKITGGKTTNKDFLKAVNFLHKAGFKEKDIEVYILFGLPGQTLNEIIESINFVKDNGATPKIVEYSLIPSTPDYNNFFKNIEIDPLLHNNSLFYINYSSLKYEDLLYLRHNYL